MQAHPQRYPVAVVQAELEDIFKYVDNSLARLLRSVETALPFAEQASKEGGIIRRDLGDEKQQMKRAEEDQPFWRKLFNSTHGQRLRADIHMAGKSIDTMVDLRYNLENTRSFLRTYRSQG